MAWIKRSKNVLNEARDSKIVRDGFIIAESTSTTFGILDKDYPENIFKRGIFAPIFQIMKVHRNHPVKISSLDMGFTKIYPLSDENVSKNNFRFPGEVYKDKINYDVVSFMMVPYDVTGMDRWEKFPIKKGFVSASKEEGVSSLLYLEHGLSIDNPYCVSEVMPSQVLQHLFSWMYNGKKINSHEKTFNQKLEGLVWVPDNPRFKLINPLTEILEKRYNTHLTFKR